MIDRTVGWVWHQYYAGDAPTPRVGSTFAVVSEQKSAVVVKQLRVGFAVDELGEAAWTARDLT